MFYLNVQEEFNKKVAKYSFIIGFSVIISLIFTNYLKRNVDEYILLVSNLDRYTIIFIFFAFIMIIEGISLFRKPINTQNISGTPIIKFIKEYKYYFFVVAQYGALLGFIAIYMNDSNIVYSALKESYHKVVLFNIIPTLIVLLEITKGVEGLIAILKSNVPDSKDRLSIVITVLATIISAIALLK